jgi:hypothetical protein
MQQPSYVFGRSEVFDAWPLFIWLSVCLKEGTKQCLLDRVTRLQHGIATDSSTSYCCKAGKYLTLLFKKVHIFGSSLP